MKKKRPSRRNFGTHRLIISYDEADISPSEALEAVTAVVREGRISGGCTHFCWHTIINYRDREVHVSTRRKSSETTDSLHVWVKQKDRGQ